MTGPLHDDELRAMLQERSARVSPDAERSAMATFRATVRGTSDGKGGFAVLPQALSSRGARLPWGIAAFGVVAVIVVAVLGGQLSGTNVSSSPTLATSAAVSTPAAGGPGDNRPDVLDAAGLARALAAGDLAPQVVVVNARIASTDCEPAVGCDYSIVGMPGVPVALGEDLVTGATIAPAFDEASVLPYAFRVRADGVLVLLGVVGDGLEVPLGVDRLATTPPPVGGLSMVATWIVSQGSADPSAEPCSLPKLLPPECSAARTYVLTGVRPGPDASVALEHALPVDVAADARPGLFPPSGGATFLVRRGVDGWRVEGRYVAFVPDVETPPASPAAGGSMTPDELRAGLADGSLAGRFIVLDGEIRLMQVPCREPLACTVPTLPRLDAVPVAADPSLKQAMDLQPPEGRLVFVADGVGLTFLGVADGSLDRPITVGELAAADPMTSSTRVRLVAGSLGIPLCLGGCPMSSAGPGPASWLSDPIGTGSPETVPVEVSDPLILRTDDGGRFLVRGNAATDAWVVVAVVGQRPIIRVSLP